MDTLDGPGPVGRNGQVTVPKAVLDRLRIGHGDRVFFVVSDDEPETVQLVPYAVFARRYAIGDRSERLTRMTAVAESNATVIGDDVSP